MTKSSVFIVCCLWFVIPSVVLAQSFPVGWFDLVNQDLNPFHDPAEIAATGANYVTAYRLWPDYGQDIQNYLSSAAQQGLFVVLDIRYVVDNLNNGTGWEDVLTDAAIAYGNHPALAGWFTAEKPAMYPQYSLLNCQTAYGILKSQSDRPVFMVFAPGDMDVNNPGNYSGTYDVMMMEFNPAGQAEAEFAEMLAWKNVSIQARQQATVSGKPFYSIIQAVGDVSYMGWNYRLPTKQEERFMVYYSILAANSDGITFMAHNYLKDTTLTEDVYIYDGPQWLKDVGLPVGLELRTFVRALGAGPLGGGVNDGNADVSSQVYQDPTTRKYYLLSVNEESTDLASITFTLDLPVSFAHAMPMSGDGPWIPIVGDSFSDNFSGYEVNNYELLPTVRTCQDIVDEGCGVVGDLDSDCYVTVVDIAVMAENWLNCNDPANDSCEQ